MKATIFIAKQMTHWAVLLQGEMFSILPEAHFVSCWCIPESRWRSHTGVAYSSCGLHIQPDVMNLISWWRHCPVSPSLLTCLHWTPITACSLFAFNPETNPLLARDESYVCNCIILMMQIRNCGNGVYSLLCKSIIM